MFRSIFVGGTFDGLHKGHESVLSRAFREAKRITVGLTSDFFIKKFKLQNSNFKIENSLKISNSKLKIRTHKVRKQIIEKWLQANKLDNRASIIPIDDPYEPVASGDFDALIVTRDNRKTGEEINRRRRQKGLSELALIEVPLVSAQDHAPISSTRVRNGEIDHKGRLIMPQSLIPALRMPLGEIIGEEEIRYKITDLRNNTIITVGDMTTKRLLDLGITPDLSVIDGKVGRKPFHDAIDMLQPEKASPRPVGGQAFQATRVKSGPGYLATRAIQAVKATLEKIATQATQARQVGQGTQATQESQVRQAWQVKQVIIVDGEEDLLALPAILYAPMGSVVLYGQPASPYTIQGGPQAGIVIVQIDQKVKNLVQKLMKKFLVSK